MLKYNSETNLDSDIDSDIDKYAIYLRKSRADLEAEKIGDGETLARHKKILTDLAARKGLYVSKIYEEIISGETIEARPEIQKLIQDCYDGKYRGILVVEVTRLSRGNQGDAQTIMDCLKYSNYNKGLLVVTPTKTYDIVHSQEDEEYMEFELFMSRREYKMIKKRLERGRMQAIVEGNYMASHRPYGYNIVKTKTGRTLIPNKDEAPIVKLIFDLAADNVPLLTIARRLKDMGVPTYNGDYYWSRVSVKRILENPVYIGKVRWNNRTTIKTMVDGKIETRLTTLNKNHYMEYDGKHKKYALTDEETFAKVNSRLTETRTKYDYKLVNPLAGLLRCKKCGRVMNLRTYDSRKYNVSPRYNHDGSPYCKLSSVMYTDVIDTLIRALELYIEDFKIEINNDFQHDDTNIQMQIQTLKREETKLKQKITKLFDSWENGILNDNEFIERKVINNESLENIQRQIRDLEKSIPEKIDYKEKIILLSNAVESLRDDAVSAKIKNDYLKEIISTIEYSRERPGEFILDIELL